MATTPYRSSTGPGSDSRPSRALAHTLLCWRLTLQASAGLGILAVSIVVLLSFALWFAFGGLDAWLPVRIFIALASLASAVLLLSWLWLPPHEVSGVELQRADAPDFFRLLDELCRMRGAGHIDRVLIGADMNASVVQLPELGLWGPLRTTLVVGLPLLHSVSPRQLQAILAHELSHLALQRGSGAAWAAQLRGWWHRVLIQIDEDSSLPGRSLAALLQKHADSYLVAAVRLSHFEEFEADAGAALLVGPESLAEALVEVALKERYLREQYWDEVMNQFEFPAGGLPFLPFRSMGIGVSLGFRRTDAAAEVCDLYAQAEGLELHPRLIERLAALEVGPHTVVTEGPTAAERFLGDSTLRLACRLDRAWCMALEPCCD